MKKVDLTSIERIKEVMEKNYPAREPILGELIFEKEMFVKGSPCYIEELDKVLFRIDLELGQFYDGMVEFVKDGDDNDLLYYKAYYTPSGKVRVDVEVFSKDFTKHYRKLPTVEDYNTVYQYMYFDAFDKYLDIWYDGYVESGGYMESGEY